MKKANVWVCVCFLPGMGVAAAEEFTITGRSEAGFVMSRGNTETETANARINVVRESEKWRHLLDLGGLYGRSTESEIASRWNVFWQTDHRFAKDDYLFGNARYEDDRYSGFDYQATLSTGAGHEFISSDTTKLHAQIGVGYRQLRTELLTLDPTGLVIGRAEGEEQSRVVGNCALNFEHSFNDSTKVTNAINFEASADNTLTRNELALHVKMNKVLALSLGLSLRENSNPPPPLKERDTLTTVNVVYERKKE